MTQSIGDRIKFIRKQNKKTQKELADLLGVTAQVISNWEREYSSPTHEDMSKLSKVLNISSDYLLFGYEANLLFEVLRSHTEEERKLIKNVLLFIFDNGDDLIQQVINYKIELDSLIKLELIDLTIDGKSLTLAEKQKILKMLNVLVD